MTVGQLKDMLADYDDEIEVKLAQQPTYPFEYSVGEVEAARDFEGQEVVFIGEGDQLAYLNVEASEALGWR